MAGVMLLANPARALKVSRNLSDLDRTIILALQEDGRKSFASMARDLGVSERKISARVSELVAENVVHITIVGDPRALGYSSPGLVGIKVSGRTSARELAQSLASIEELAYVAATTGRYQILAECFCVDEDHLASVIAQMQEILETGFEMEIFPYVEVSYQQIHFEAAYAKRRRDEASIGAPRGHLTRIDAEIITQLADDGRAKFKDIAEDLKISEGQVRQRYQRLVGRGSVRVQAIVNPRSLGFEHSAWIGLQLEPGASVEAVVNALADTRGVTYVAMCLGRFQIFAEILAKDLRELQRVIEGDVGAMQDVRTVEPFVYLSLHYKPVQPLVAVSTRRDGRQPISRDRRDADVT